MSQSELKAIACSRRQARENTLAHVVIGLGFACHWLRNWREFFWPITQRSNAKPKKKTQLAIDAQMKTTL